MTPQKVTPQKLTPQKIITPSVGRKRKLTTKAKEAPKSIVKPKAGNKSSDKAPGVLPPKKRKTGHETKVRNILRRASTAPGQSKVSDYFISPLSDTLPDLEDFDLGRGPVAMSSPTKNRPCICSYPAPALSPINYHRIHSNATLTRHNVIVISDSD